MKKRKAKSGKAETMRSQEVPRETKRQILNAKSSKWLKAARKDSARLTAEIIGGNLVINIGVATLAFAAEECDGNPKVEILDAKQLAADVIAELKHEDEVGASMLTNLFDEAVIKAMENGSVAFADTDNCKSYGGVITKGATSCPHCFATDFQT